MCHFKSLCDSPCSPIQVLTRLKVNLINNNKLIMALLISAVTDALA